MLSDLRHSLRVLRATPSLTLAAVSMLALAIGATAAVFSVVDGVLVRRLPIEHPDRIVVMWARETTSAGAVGEISYPTFRAWQTEARGFEQLAALGSTTWTLILREGEPATIPVAAVSASFFPLLGTNASIGRTLRDEEDQRASNRVAVLSHRSWVRRFGADPAIVGRGLRFQNAVYTIVGVMPEGFEYPRGAEMWVPLVPELEDAGTQWKSDLLSDANFGVLYLLGRLRADVALETARNHVSALIARRVGSGFRAGMEAALTPLDEYIFGNTRPALIALAACVVLVLLIGCANVAVLLLGRATARAHETATRLAMGATRWRIIRQSLADALLLTSSATVVGLGLAYWTIDVLAALAPPEVPRLDFVHVDIRTLAFTGLTCLVTAMLVGLGPGVQSSRRTLANALTSGNSRTTRAHRLRRSFVVVQVSLALVLLVCAGLVGRSLLNLLQLDIGFQPSNVLTMDVTIPAAEADRHNPFYAALLARVRAMPGVEAAGAVFLRPLEHAAIGMDSTLIIEGQQVGPQYRAWEQNPIVNLESITPGYFEAIGTVVIRGRAFTDADIMSAPRVAIVGERLARRLWPGQNPIGKRMLPPGQGSPGAPPRWATVVGVVQDARYRGLTDARYDLYLPYLQIPGMLVKHLMVKASVDPLSLIPTIRAEARRLEQAVLVENAQAMDVLVRRATAPWQFSAWTLGLLGLLALVLASLGVYATVSHTVVERTREIGVRVAVGALPREIASLVLREGLGVTIVGIAIGSAIAMASGRLLTSLLFEVAPIDPLTMTSMATVFIIVSALAIVVPAWRAARVDPAVALRHQ